jgi:hypothetical protein
MSGEERCTCWEASNNKSERSIMGKLRKENIDRLAKCQRGPSGAFKAKYICKLVHSSRKTLSVRMISECRRSVQLDRPLLLHAANDYGYHVVLRGGVI